MFVDEYITYRDRDLIFIKYMDRVKRDTKCFPKPESEIIIYFINIIYYHFNARCGINTFVIIIIPTYKNV